MSDLPIRVFVSYSHADAEYLAEGSLLGFLRGLEREGVEFWTDEAIAAGSRWDEEIRSRIARTDIALVLVSQTFLDSDYCTNLEITGFLDRRRESGLIIVPVTLSPCEWERHAWLSSTQYLPGGGETVEEDFVDAGARKRLFACELTAADGAAALDHHGRAYQAAQQILAASEAAPQLRLEADRVLGSSLFYLGRMEEARRHFENAIAYYDRGRDHSHVLVYGQDPGVSCLANATLALWFLGHVDQALARGEEAVSLARELGHPYSLCYALFFCSWQFVYRRDVARVQACAEEMIQVSRHQTFPFWETMGIILDGWVATQRGDAAGGLATVQDGIAKWRRLGARLYLPSFLCLVAETHAGLGDAAAGLAAVEQALAVLVESDETFSEPELYRLKGDLLWLAAERSAVASPAVEECLVRAREGAAAEAEARR